MKVRSAPQRLVGALTARRAARSGILWGLLFASIVAASAAGYASTFPTAASRDTLARSFGSNAGLAALLGPARRLDTVAGFTAWRTMGVMSIVGAFWGLLAATRLLRGEEEAGRWELLLAGQTTRRGATAQAVVGLGVGAVALWAVTAMGTWAVGLSPDVGFSLTGSLFLATALVASAVVFLAVGALSSQLAATRRQANAIGAAVFGVAFLVRMVADSASQLKWLRWASPLGWVEELRPLTGSRPLALLPLGLAAALLAGGAIGLAARRDVGAGALPAAIPARRVSPY